MVIRANLCAALMVLSVTGPGLAKSPQDQMFPGPGSCYARVYSADHLAKHPDQRVTQFAIRPDFAIATPMLAVQLQLSLRGTPGGKVEATAYCENEGGSTLYCTMEGDAGGFQITPVKGGAILISVSSLGMGFETDTDFVTLDRDRGDDRSFLLQPGPCP